MQMFQHAHVIDRHGARELLTFMTSPGFWRPDGLFTVLGGPNPVKTFFSNLAPYRAPFGS